MSRIFQQAAEAMRDQRERDFAELQLQINATERHLAGLRRQQRELGVEPEPALMAEAGVTPEEVAALNLDFGDVEPAPDADVMQYDPIEDEWHVRRNRK